MQSFARFQLRRDHFRRNKLGMRPRTPGLHLFGKGLDFTNVLFQLDLRDKRAFPALAVRHPQTTQRLKGLPRGHTADAQASGDDLFRRKRLPRLQLAGTNVLKKMLLNLVVKRNGAVPVEFRQVHRSPQLSRQLGSLYFLPAPRQAVFPRGAVETGCGSLLVNCFPNASRTPWSALSRRS